MDKQKQTTYECEKCRSSDRYKGIGVMGDAYCEKHNYRFPFYQEPCPPCPICAGEEGLCISCGDKLPEKGEDSIEGNKGG